MFPREMQRTISTWACTPTVLQETLPALAIMKCLLPSNESVPYTSILNQDVTSVK